ncbi:MAG: hypothetical protein AAGN66_15535 [Acidobacteriota bacterium]
MAPSPESIAKAQMMAIIQDLPEDSSFDEILREMAFHRMVERGHADADSGNVIDVDELQRRIRSWRR